MEALSGFWETYLVTKETAGDQKNVRRILISHSKKIQGDLGLIFLIIFDLNNVWVDYFRF